MPKILMIDDDLDFLEASKRVLDSKGYEVVIVNKLEEADATIKTYKPDLILLDIMMENADDGIAFAQKLRRDGVTLPIVMLSGVSKVTGYDYKKCDDVLPCDDFLEKPVSAEKLINKVESILKIK
ncbi:MAG: response regulator [Candidatus Omnitrophica bacterium]|nr:response regulator [Candidatus Omnitrophota bacterium]